LMNDATNAPNIAAADYATESAKLTAEAQALKNRIDELRRDLAEASQVRHDQTASMSNYNADSRIRKVVSENTSAEYRLRLYSIGTADPHSEPAVNIDMMKDAQNLAQAVRVYAREHHGDFPPNFEVAAPYFYAEYRTPRASEFELIYQGSYNEFTNIPDQQVAVVRERHAWPTPAGKWARIYFMANGMMKLVESDDNFKSWEAEHIIPTQAAADNTN